MSKQPLSFRDYSDPMATGSTIAKCWFEWNNIRVGARNLWAEIDTYVHATDTSPFEGSEVWDHKTYIPVIPEIQEDLQAILYSTILPHEDWLGWRGFTADDFTKEKRTKLTALAKQMFRLNGFRKVMRRVIDDYSRYGNCFGQVVYQDNVEPLEDGFKPTEYSGPALKRISPYDIVFNPTASTFEGSPKIIRSIMSIGEFLMFANKVRAQGLPLDEEAVQGVLDQRSTGTQTTDTSNRQKNQQYVPDGFGTIEQYWKSGFVEMLWFYGSVYDEETQTVTQDRLITVVDRQRVLFDVEEKNPRVYKGSWKTRPDNLWSQGPLDNLVSMAFMVNHRENAKNDAIDRFIFPDRAYVGDVEEIYDEVTGQTKYLMTEGGSVNDITPDTTVLTYDSQIANHVEMMRRASRLPQQLVGFKAPGEQTAAEFTGLNEGAFRGFLNKSEQFEQEFLEPVVKAHLEVARDNFSSVIKVMNEDQEGIITLLDITKDDLETNGKLLPYGSRRFSRNLQQLNGINQLVNTNLISAIGKHLDTFNLGKTWEELSGFEQYKLVDKFAAIDEAVEEQQVTTIAQQQSIQQASEPTLTELELDASEDTELPE